jgi:ureidoacrylate peracid hydrolase
MGNPKDPFDICRRIAHVQPLSGLEQKVRPQHAALLVIDMQNDFCAPEGLVAKGGRDVSAAQEMAGRLPELIAAARAAGVLVVFVRNVYSSDRNFYLSDVWLEQAARKQGGGYTSIPVCAAGSWEGDFYGAVRPEPGDPVVTKHRYSAFYNTDLDTILRSHGVRTVIATGVSTNVCVETTVREAFVRDYYVVLVADGTAAYTPEEHDKTLKDVDRFFGEITTIADLKSLWAKGTQGLAARSCSTTR